MNTLSNCPGIVLYGILDTILSDYSGNGNLEKKIEHLKVWNISKLGPISVLLKSSREESSLASRGKWLYMLQG